MSTAQSRIYIYPFIMSKYKNTTRIFYQKQNFHQKREKHQFLKNDQSIEITSRHKYISATQQLIIEFGAFLLSVWVLHSHQKCRQWNSNDVQEFFLGKKRTNLMVVRPILPVVELPIEGGKQQLKTLIKTSNFPLLFNYKNCGGVKKPRGQLRGEGG